jgi:hypothetical protein
MVKSFAGVKSESLIIKEQEYFDRKSRRQKSHQATSSSGEEEDADFSVLVELVNIHLPVFVLHGAVQSRVLQTLKSQRNCINGSTI